eukprot:SM000026S08870  [mRNA]  locus=s26:187046:188569:+ [translate_table: standard]
MPAPPAADAGPRALPPAPAVLEEAFLACLDAADRLLASREALSRALQAGWFDLARARYSMGPSSIGRLQYDASPSLAPPATTVGLAAAGDDGVRRLILQARQAGQGEQAAGKPPWVIAPGSPPSPAAASGSPELDDLVSSISLAASPCMEERATPCTKLRSKKVELARSLIACVDMVVIPLQLAVEVANTQSQVDHLRARYLELKEWHHMEVPGNNKADVSYNNCSKSDAMAPEPKLNTQDLARIASP